METAAKEARATAKARDDLSKVSAATSTTM
jgi:hypothetical protein